MLLIGRLISLKISGKVFWGKLHLNKDLKDEEEFAWERIIFQAVGPGMFIAAREKIKFTWHFET